MFIDFVNSIFAGCNSDLEKFFVMVIFIFLLELVGEMIAALCYGAGGGHR